MFKCTKIHDQGPIPGAVKEYTCTSTADVDNLPRFGIDGKQAGTPFDNAPCGYGSQAVVVNKTNNTMSGYVLDAENEWTKVFG